MGAIKVLVVEPGVRLTHWLQLALGSRPSVAVLGPVADVSDLAGAADGAGPDLVLLDADGDAGDLWRSIDAFRRADPEARILVSGSDGDDVAIAAAALSAGACGVLVRSLTGAQIEHVFSRALAGEVILPDTQLRSLLDRGAHDTDSARARLATLTARERQVLTLLAEGWSTVDVAERLGISAGTVQTHVKSVLSKLGVHSKVEAIRLAWRHGTLAVPA